MPEKGPRPRGSRPRSASVIIPSHGRPDSLDRCLASLADQTYPRYEVVVVDDASPQREAYAAVARQYGARLLRNAANGGPSVGRNRAVRESTGDVLIFLDDDCTAHDPDWIAKHVRMHADRPGLLVGGGIDVQADTLIGQAFAQINQPEFRVAGNLQGMNLSLTRTTFNDIGPFREDLRELEDVEFSLRARGLGKHLQYAHDIRITHHGRDALPVIVRRMFQHGYWLVPAYKASGFGGHSFLPGSFVSALVLFLPLAGAHAVVRVLVSATLFPAVVVCLPLAFLFCLSHAAGVVWYHWRARRAGSAVAGASRRRESDRRPRRTPTRRERP